MGRKTVGALASFLLVSSGTVAAQADELAHPTVVVRTYDGFGVPADDLRVARSEVETTLREAGIDISWIDCGPHHHELDDVSPRCADPLAGNDLVLRLQVSRGADLRKFVSMGFSLVSPGAEPAYLSTVFPDVARSVAHGAGVDFDHVLGLAMAHEIGHLLLNTASHARAGLMRADWSRQELHRNAAADWRFLASEASTMRQAIAKRTGGN
jgi:hypothetical protein